MRKIVHILGNPLVVQDRLPLKIIPALRKVLPRFDFIHLDPTEEFATTKQDLIIIDTVINIERVTCFNDLSNLSISPRNTVHDFDLTVSLKLLQKLGKLRKITIIGIPPKGNRIEIIAQIKKLLESL